ncbi:hypothetical protein NBRC111894_4210 [Sporolactobacillus inulinus]|uniref:Uncharacterized protein n=1 Tax=Sporolactobacillus inulinus TaxID=2078 RepID=A0A4Y1ZHG7_9BACL|nr:hypothetical protein NBRC111894_4210 [Sporolactobacillus inulinus]
MFQKMSGTATGWSHASFGAAGQSERPSFAAKKRIVCSNQDIIIDKQCHPFLR